MVCTEGILLAFSFCRILIQASAFISSFFFFNIFSWQEFLHYIHKENQQDPSFNVHVLSIPVSCLRQYNSYFLIVNALIHFFCSLQHLLSVQLVLQYIYTRKREVMDHASDSHSKLGFFSPAETRQTSSTGNSKDLLPSSSAMPASDLNCPTSEKSSLDIVILSWTLLFSLSFYYVCILPLCGCF